MDARLKRKLAATVGAVAGLAALALGGSTIAGAVTSDNGTTSVQSVASSGAESGADQRSDEQLLTGATASSVTKAALAKAGGGTVERVETDADGNAAYEAHIVRSDGTRVTVYVDEQFNVVGVDEQNAGNPESNA